MCMCDWGRWGSVYVVMNSLIHDTAVTINNGVGMDFEVA